MVPSWTPQMLRRCGPTLDAADVSEATLIAGSRWLIELASTSVAQAGISLRTIPRYIDLTPTQYEHALEWLRSLDFVGSTSLKKRSERGDPVQALLEIYLELHNPIWLDEVGGLIAHEVDLPLDILEISSRIGLDDPTAFASAQNVARKFDDQRLKQIGRAGELAFFEWASVHSSIPPVWVSETDDTAGYDILISEPSARAEVEVKTTTTRNRVRFFLSRNEFEHLRASASWCLQIVVLDISEHVQFFFVTGSWILSVAPCDSDPAARWSSVQITVPRDALERGPHPNVRSALSI